MKTPITTYKKHTYLLYLALLLGMASCGFLGTDTKEKIMDTADKNSKAMQAPKKTSQSSGYVVKPNLDHPKFKELSEAFDKEEHRFEIDACEFKYNGQSFFIGDPMEKIVKIFGEPDENPQYNLKKTAFYIKYKTLQLAFWFTETEQKIKTVTFHFSEHIEGKIVPFDIIKFRKIPYRLDMTLNEFMELSDMDHEKVDHSLSDFYIKNERSCESFENIRIRTSIGSSPAYDNIGGGHLTIRGDFDPKVTGEIENIVISLKK